MDKLVKLATSSSSDHEAAIRLMELYRLDNFSMQLGEFINLYITILKCISDKKEIQVIESIDALDNKRVSFSIKTK